MQDNEDGRFITNERCEGETVEEVDCSEVNALFGGG